MGQRGRAEASSPARSAEQGRFQSVAQSFGCAQSSELCGGYGAKLGLAIQFSQTNAARNVQTHSPLSSTPTRLRLLLHPSTTRTQPCHCSVQPYLHAGPHNSPRARLIQHKTAPSTYTHTHVDASRLHEHRGGRLGTGQHQHQHQHPLTVTAAEALRPATVNEALSPRRAAPSPPAMAEVLHTPREGSPFGGTPMARTTSTSNLYSALTSPRRNHFSLNDLRAQADQSESSRASSLHSESSSSLSLDTRLDESSSEDDGLSFPDYGKNRKGFSKPVDPFDYGHAQGIGIIGETLPPFDPQMTSEGSLSTDTPLTTPDPVPVSEDDTAVRKEPSRHVDYLSYEWREEDIWSSWRHIVEHRSVYGERSRLENASWRTWAKSQFKLRTVSPETLNW